MGIPKKEVIFLVVNQYMKLAVVDVGLHTLARDQHEEIAIEVAGEKEIGAKPCAYEIANSGLQVIDLYQQEANDLQFIKKRIPYTTLKFVKLITSECIRQDTHQLRDKQGANLVGIKTRLTEKPNLTTKLPRGGKNPIRMILDTRLRIPD